MRGVRYWYVCLGIGLILLCILFFVGGFARRDSIFKSHLSGWYPTESAALKAALHEDQVRAQEYFNADLAGAQIRACIVPHAGYRYSGDVASAVYRLIDPQFVKRIIILAPSHSVLFEGVALPSFAGYELPNGTVSIDTKTCAELTQKTLFKINDSVYQTEHSLEMQLPLCVHYLPQAEVVPLIVGLVTIDQMNEVAMALKPYITDTTLVVVSSDFTHYGTSYGYTPFHDHIQDRIRQLDSGALQAIQKFSLTDFLEYVSETQITICGRYAIGILLALLQKSWLGAVTSSLIAYKTSGEMTPSAESSVSYVGMLFVDKQKIDPTRPLRVNEYERRSLLELARAVLRQIFDKNIPVDLLKPILTETTAAHRGAFVTLKKNGQLRGCIGRVSADQPLYQTVIDMTRAAALHDSRFSPVTADEVGDLTISISILTEPKVVRGYRDIVIGRDGIILSQDKAQALFLPTVPVEFRWDLQTTLAQLSQKAGLKVNAWQEPETVYQTFESTEIE